MRGLGHLQREILKTLCSYTNAKGGHWLDTGFVCVAVWHDPAHPLKLPTDAQERSYRRAVAKLVKARLVKRGHLKTSQRNYLLTITDAGKMAAGYMFAAPVDIKDSAALNDAMAFKRSQERRQRDLNVLNRALERHTA